MLIEGYDGGPLVNGELLVTRPGFWSNHLLGWCSAMGAQSPVPEWFGEDGADVDATSELLMDRQQWPVLQVPFAEGHSAVVVYRNLLGDYGVDYLVTHPTWSHPRHIASWEGDWTGGVLTWDELRHIVDSPTTEGITDHAARLLLLIPLLDLLDVHEPPAEQAAARLSTALTAIGVPQDTAPTTAQHLLDCCAKGIWHDPTWTAPPSS